MKKMISFLLTASLYAQQFEVATMKALPQGAAFAARTTDGAQLRYPAVSLLGLLREAYRLRSPEQVEGPDWMRSQAYAIEGKLPSGASTAQIPEMLQALLAERLKLTVHHATKPLLSNVLVIPKKGPKLRSVPASDGQLELKLEVPVAHITGRGSIQNLVDQLNHGLGGRDPWIDMTGLQGSYEIKLDFTLNYHSDPAKSEPGETSGALPLADALAQQLGLRVEARKTPADIVVVDRVEKIPSSN